MISGPSTYLATIDDFLAHWTSVNADPAAGTGLATRDGKTRADLVAVRATLAAVTNGVEDRLNGKEIARALVENGKRDLLARAQELCRRLRGVLPADSPFLASLPAMPLQSSAEEVFLKPMRDCANVWQRADDAGVKFTLTGNFGVAAFATQLAGLIGRYTTLHTAASDLKLSRETRNKLQNDVTTLLSGYRPAVEGLFPPDSPLVATVPVIYAPSGPRTPKPVAATATYDAAAHEAVVAFTASDDTALARYELRGVPGPDYAGEDETLIATLAPDAPREFRTAFSLAQPGMAASFKVYVILTTGNEAGSDAVTVERGE